MPPAQAVPTPAGHLVPWSLSSVAKLGLVVGPVSRHGKFHNHRICCIGRDPQGLQSSAPSPAEDSPKGHTMCLGDEMVTHSLWIKRVRGGDRPGENSANNTV